MKIETTGTIVSIGRTADKNTKEGVKQFQWGTAKLNGRQGNGQIVTITRTLGAAKAPISVGMEVTLHADTDNVLTGANGQRFMTFEVQTGQKTASLEDVFSAFGVKQSALQPEAKKA